MVTEADASIATSSGRRLRYVTDEAPMAPETVTRMLIAAIPWAGGSALVAYDEHARFRDLKEEIARRGEIAGEEQIGRITRLASEERLLVRLRDDPLLEALFVNSVDAALRTGLEAKRQLLARVVAEAVLDDAKLDESQLISETLADLDVPHIRALMQMRDEWQSEGEHDEVNFGTSTAYAQAHPSIRATLVRTATARSAGSTRTARNGRHRQSGITEFGLTLIAALEAEGLAQQLSPRA